MDDPYRVLGVSPDVSDEELKKAYRELARKYHPDNYQNNPLADLAEEKMKEINEAYDSILKARAGGGSSSYGHASSGTAYQARQNGEYQSRQAWTSGSYQSQQSSYAGGNALFSQVRRRINLGDLTGAEQLLRQASQRNAEWHFLAGHIAYKKGWLDEATQHFRTACSMEPGNAEYRQALSMMQQGSARYQPAGTGGSCFGMDPCTAWLCFTCLTPWGGPCC